MDWNALGQYSAVSFGFTRLASYSATSSKDNASAAKVNRTNWHITEIEFVP